jgi:RND family efflux transporter MFP subunit
MFRRVYSWCVFVIVVTSCGRRPEPAPEAVAVKVVLVKRTNQTPTVKYSAQIVPATRIDLAFRVGGYVESIATMPDVEGNQRPIQEGDAVQHGMTLATIRRSDYEQRLAEANAAYAQANAGYDQAALDYNRSHTLADQNAVAGAELDNARTRRRSAGAASSGARARREQAATALADTVLKSPIDGVILKRTVEVGTLASPGVVAFAIADVTKVKAAFGVPDTMLRHVHIGDVEKLATESYPDETFEGRISLIAPSADPKSRVFEVDVTLRNPDGRLKSGSIASLSLPLAEDAPALPLVPVAAIVQSPTHADKFAVFVVETHDGATVAKAREVEVGDFLGRVVPIKRGLAGGERVIVQGTGLVSDGELVEVMP